MNGALLNNDPQDYEALAYAIDEIVPSEATYVGFIAQSMDGRFLLTEPAGHAYGVSATWSKVKRITSERPSGTLERCLREQVGVGVRSVFPIPYVWATPNSLGFYFTGLVAQGMEEDALVPSSGKIAALQWLTEERAREQLETSSNIASRRRDLGLLEYASRLCVSPYRRILLMVRELHQMGYERLRAPTYLAAVGAWRCPVLPAAWTLKRHGGIQVDYSEVIPTGWHSLHTLHGFQGNAPYFTYTSANEQKPFEWMGMSRDLHDGLIRFASPRELAKQFVRQYPELAFAGWGRDKEYVRWFTEALALTAPNGVWYSFAEFQPACDHLYTEMTGTPRLPLPPPGEASEGSF